MSEEQPLSAAERVKLAKERMAQARASVLVAPGQASHMFSEDDTKLVSDKTAERMKNAGTLAAVAGKWGAGKAVEAAKAAAEKAMQARDAAERMRADHLARKEVQANVVPEPLPPVAVVPTTPAAPVVNRAAVEVQPVVADALLDFDADEFADAPMDVVAQPQALMDESPEIAAPVPAVQVPALEAKAEMNRATNPRKKVMVAGAVLAVVLAGGGIWWWTQRSPVVPVPTVVKSAPAAEVAPLPAPPVAPEPIAAVPLPELGIEQPEPIAAPPPAVAEVATAPKPEPVRVVKSAPVKVAPTRKAEPKLRVVEPPKPVQPTAPEWQDKAMHDLDAFEEKLGG